MHPCRCASAHVTPAHRHSPPAPSAPSNYLAPLASLALCAIAIVLTSTGCGGEPPVPQSPNSQMFTPASMRIHPIFTQLKDWTGEGVPTGVEVLLEFQDQFGDPCKASGQVIFEIYEMQKFSAQRRGRRLQNPYTADLTSPIAQRDRWNRTSQTYTFQLYYKNIPIERNYLITAEYQGDNGQRLFDQIVLEAQPPPTTVPTTGPVTRPG